MNTLNLLLYTIPFWVPALAGVYLCVTSPNRISRMAGLLTLKPIIATPIWFAILGNDPSPKVVTLVASMLPGIGLTSLIIVLYWRLLSGPHAGAAKALLVLDSMRWLNSAVLVALGISSNLSDMTGSLACIFAQLGLVLPTVFAVVALTISLLGSRGNQVQEAA